MLHAGKRFVPALSTATQATARPRTAKGRAELAVSREASRPRSILPICPSESPVGSRSGNLEIFHRASVHDVRALLQTLAGFFHPLPHPHGHMDALARRFQISHSAPVFRSESLPRILAPNPIRLRFGRYSQPDRAAAFAPVCRPRQFGPPALSLFPEDRPRRG